MCKMSWSKAEMCVGMSLNFRSLGTLGDIVSHYDLVG